MIGNRVKVIRENANDFEGVLLKSDRNGIIVHDNRGLNDFRVFIPLNRIIEIRDLGRVP